MTVKSFIDSLSSFFKRWFHKRNIIIVSERKVKHIHIGGHIQFVVALSILGGVCWMSYSTGSFIAARSALKEQGQALRSVTNAHIESTFNTAYQPVENPTPTMLPYKRPTASIALSSPADAFASLDNARLVARIVSLENKVIELKQTNEEIVQRVQDKTAENLTGLENIIQKTGLNVDDLKKQYTSNKHPDADGKKPAEGGPYIPDSTMNLTPQAKDMFSNLDRLVLLRHIVNNLPLSSPIAGAEEQSPFGHRIDPFNGHLAFHSGLDLAGPIGSQIHSTANGTVISAHRSGAYGNVIDIDHGAGITTRYAH